MHVTDVHVSDLETGATDWGAMVDEENWKSSHSQKKLDKQTPKIEEVTVATCSDDGTITIWRPLQVRLDQEEKYRKPGGTCEIGIIVFNDMHDA